VNEVFAAILGASISTVAMLLANSGHKRERYTVEIFKRLNNLDTKVARLEEKSKYNKTP
tara:strand:+ start:815 stop:991 length:177 start_codon:yes stop_codon:yes gene_type:complete